MRKTDMRKTDGPQQQFSKSERVYMTGSGWYFAIRQGASFGPYENKQNAVKSLQSYVGFLNR